jgi:hypothetical protein
VQDYPLDLSVSPRCPVEMNQLRIRQDLQLRTTSSHTTPQLKVLYHILTVNQGACFETAYPDPFLVIIQYRFSNITIPVRYLLGSNMSFFWPRCVVLQLNNLSELFISDHDYCIMTKDVDLNSELDPPL